MNRQKLAYLINARAVATKKETSADIVTPNQTAPLGIVWYPLWGYFINKLLLQIIYNKYRWTSSNH